MIPMISDVCKQPGILVGIGIGICIGAFLRSPTSSDQNLLPFEANNEEEIEDWNEDEFLVEAEVETKLVIVIRTDLKMGKGKIAAQCCHATLKAYKQLKRNNPRLLRQWESKGQPKVVVKANNDESLYELASRATSLGLTASLIQDAGRTQVAPGSLTVLGIGPGPIELVDKVSGHLKLY